MSINGNLLCWKSSSCHFVYLSFCFVLGFLDLFAYATAFLSFTGNAPLIFCFELKICFKTVSQIIFLISLFFSCYYISALVAFLIIKHILHFLLCV